MRIMNARTRLRLLRMPLALLLSCAVLAPVEAAKIKPVMLPDPKLMATHGFIIGTLAGGNGRSAENFPDEFVLQIDDAKIDPWHSGRTFMVAVTPGQHVLHRASAKFGTDDYVNHRKEFSVFPLEQTFTVEAGKVTTLGAMYLYEKEAVPGGTSTSNASGGYMVLAADNGRFMDEFMQRRYPEVYAALADKTLHPAYPLLNDKQYQALHQVMARAKLREQTKGALRYARNGKYLVFGALGMAGHVYTDDKGTPVRFRSFELDTFETVRDCDANATRHACVTMTWWGSSNYERRAFAGAEGPAQRLTLPEGASPIGVHLLGTDGLILGDYEYRLHVRVRAEDPWQAVKQDGIKAGAFVGGKYVFGNSPTGVYTLYEGNERTLTLTTSSDGTTQVVPLPPKFKGGAKVIVTPRHLLIGPEWNLLSASEVYLRDQQTGEWTMSKLPKGRCGWMSIDPKDTSRLLANCGFEPGTFYVSADDGLTWSAEGG